VNALIHDVREGRQEVAELGRTMGVAQGATRAFLAVLGEKQVPENQLAEKLIEIAHRYKAMQERFAVSSDPDVQPLLTQARAETREGHFTEAEELLNEASRLSLQSLESADRKALEKGREALMVSATVADMHLVKLDYQLALESLKHSAQLASKYAPELEADYQFRLGKAAIDMELWSDAIAAFERALTLVKASAEHASDAEVRLTTFLALAKGRTRQSAEAETLFREALDHYLSRNDLGNAARTLNSLSLLISAQGRHAEAIKLIQRAILMGSRLLGRRNADVAVWLNTLGNFRGEQDRWGAATRMFRAAVRIDKQTIGLDNPQALRHLANLGSALFAQERYEEGAPFLERAIERGTLSFGSSSPIILRRVANYVIYLLDTRKYDKAEGLLKAALGGETLVAENKREMAILLQNAYGRLLTETARAEQALPHLAAAFSSAQLRFGRANPSTIIIGGNLARALGELGQDEEALRKFEEAVKLIEANGLSGSNRVHRVYRYFAEYCRRRGQDARAQQLSALADRARG